MIQIRIFFPAVYLATFVCLLAFAVSHAGAQETRPALAAEAQLQQWSARLERIGEAIGAFRLDARDTARLRTEIEDIRASAVELETQLRPQIEPAQALVDALGEVPKSGQEPEDVANERQRLNENLSALTGQLKRAELTVAKASTLLSELSARKRQKLADRLLTRSANPLAAETWLNAAEDAAQGASGLAGILPRSWSWVVSDRSGTAITIGLAILLSAFVGLVARPWLLRSVQHSPVDQLPGVRALIGFLRRCAIVLPALVLVFLILDARPPSDLQWADFLRALLIISIWYTITVALLGACFAPVRTSERLFPFEDAEARAIYNRLFVISTVVASYAFIFAAGQSFGVHRETASVIAMVAAAFFAIPVFSLLGKRLWSAIVVAAKTPVGASPVGAGNPEQSTPLWSALRVPMVVGTLVIVIAAATGYEELARFGIGRSAVSVLVIIMLVFVHHVIRDAVHWLINHDASITPDAASPRRGWLILLIVDALLLAAGIVALLLIWGTGWDDISDWTNKALEGFQIGTVRISPTAVLYAAALFAVVLTVTRFLQRKIEQRVLIHTRLDSGVKNSIRSAVGYIGVIGGGVIAISAAGLDLSNLAIIAGALSVGIGFGLQNVVNNFVSGIILLVERPIRVGDWVVVGSHEGYVRRIKVRSTEIETFAHASVIVPNSDLISGTVMNWTHSDARGRIIVPVGVAYGSDTGLVRQLLLEIARTHLDVLAIPEPTVLFRGFGDSSLNFEIRVFLKDIGYCLSVTSDMCFEIDKTFREQGIEIPFPQRDLNLRDMPRLEAMIDKALAARGNAQ